jgi:hypothetical protein
MASISDRSLFFEAAKTQALTISQIVEMFGCNPNTARVWARRPEIEEVEGSWPPSFRHKNTFAQEVAVTEKPIKPKANTYLLEVPKPPQQAIETFFDELLDDVAPTFNFNEEFRRVSTVKQLREVRSMLISSLIVVEHYEEILKNEGMD